MAIKGRTLPGDFEWRGQTIDAPGHWVHACSQFG